MAIGQRIKFFRNLRKFTQKELGLKLGFPKNAADVRVAQYESETRIPKDDLINAFANLFDISPKALNVPEIDTYIGLMHTLFALEDTYGFKINKIDGQLCITLDNHNKSFSTLFENLNSWQEEYEKLTNGEITQEEYDEWRYKYPQIEAERFKRDIDKLRENKKKSE